jgi:hypothetical protein
MAYSEYGSGESGGGHPTCIAEQLVDVERGYAQGPERALLAALLFDGVQAYMNYACASSDAARVRYQEAFNWVSREGDEYVFSFENVCEALGIDAQYLRLGLLNACNSSLLERKKSRRSF